MSEDDTPSERPARQPKLPLPHRMDTSRNGLAVEIRWLKRRVNVHDGELGELRLLGVLIRTSFFWLAALTIAICVLLWRSCK